MWEILHNPKYTGYQVWKRWTASDFEEWTSSLVSSPMPLAHSTIRGYQLSVAMFTDYKAVKGSPPRRRNVLSVYDWSVEVLAQYLKEVRPYYRQSAALWPTERGTRISVDYIGARFADYRDQLGLGPELHPHCLRHSYVTHLIEDGFDPLFVQQQAGHRWASTTALYTGVSSDYKNRVLRRALDRAYGEAKAEGESE